LTIWDISESLCSKKFVFFSTEINSINVKGFVALYILSYPSWRHNRSGTNFIYSVISSEFIPIKRHIEYIFKLKKDFRCEKMLMFNILKVIYFDTSSNDTIKNILLI
jgi:hypothetical protein